MHWDWSGQQRLCCVDIYLFASAHIRKLHGSPLSSGFSTPSRFEERNNATVIYHQYLEFFCPDSIKQNGRRDQTRIFVVHEMNDGDVYERVVEVANEIGLTKCNWIIAVCHGVPPRNPGSGPINVKFVRSETIFRVKTPARNLKNWFKKF